MNETKTNKLNIINIQNTFFYPFIKNETYYTKVRMKYVNHIRRFLRDSSLFTVIL